MLTEKWGSLAGVTPASVSNTSSGPAFELLESRQLLSTFQEYAGLTPSDGSANDRFGWSVDVSGQYAFCGSFGDNGDQGSTYVFQLSGGAWKQVAKLTASDAAAGDLFGHSVSVDGEYAIIGAESADVPGRTDAGAAYIFHLEDGSWVEQAKLTASDVNLSVAFGQSVAISGDYAVIGRSGSLPGKWNSGAAYVFHREGTAWVQQAILVGNDTAELDQYGYSVAVWGDYAMVGSRLHDHGGYDATGAAYIFHRSGTIWTQQGEIVPTTADPGSDQLGYRVAIGQDVAMVSAFDGPAYIYQIESGSWVEKAKIIPNDFPDSNMAAVDITPDYAILGHRYEGHAGGSCGAAYVFVPQGGTWVQQSKLVASNAAADDNFGCSVAIDGNEVLAGALFADPSGTDSGAAYAFNLVFPVIVPLDSKGLASYHDANGELVTVQLTGGGAGAIYFDGDGNRDAAMIKLDGTTAASALTITVKGQGTTLGELDLQGGSLKSFKAKTTDLVGAGIHSDTGSIAALTLGDILNGADILLGGPGPAAGVVFAMQSIDGDTDIVLGGPLKSMTALQWQDGSLHASWAGSLTITGSKARQMPGDIGADLVFSSQDAKGISLGKLTIWATVNATHVGMPGALGAVAVGAWADGSVTAASLKSLNVKGFAPAGVLADCQADVTLTGEAGAVSVARNMSGIWTCQAVKSVTVKRDLSLADFLLSRPADPKSLALGKLTVTGVLDRVLVDTPGSTGAVSVGRWDHSHFLADSFKSLSVKGYRPGSLIGDMDGSILDVREAGSISVAGGIHDGQWNVDTIKSVTVSRDVYDLHAALNLAPDAARPALQSMKVSGWFSDSRISANGNLGQITFAAMRNSTVFAGIAATRDVNAADGVLDLPETADLNLAAPATIKKLTVTGKLVDAQGYSYLNSSIGAAVVESMALCYADSSNGGTLFGVTADWIKKLTTKDEVGTETYTNLRAPGDGFDFEDGLVRII